MSAYLYKRKHKTCTSIQVKWNDADLGRQQAQSFPLEEARLAAEFRLAVEAAGDRWPPGWDIAACRWAHEVRTVETVDEVAAAWFEHMRTRVQKGRLGSAQVDRYQRMYDLRIKPALGHLEFTAVALSHVEAWSEPLLEEVSGKTVRDYFSCVLNPIFEFGTARMGLRLDNPASGFEKPRRGRGKKELRFFAKAEWRAFRACLDPDVHDLVDTMLATGMRVGEAMALQAGDVEPHPSGGVRVHVRRAWAKRGSAEVDLPWKPGENRTWFVKCPKTGLERSVLVQGDVGDRLRTLAADRPAEAWLFTTRRGNPWRQPDFLTDRWYPARRSAATLGYSAKRDPSHLRHTFVVWAIDSGVPLVTISGWLGHTSIQTTYDHYGGLLNLESSRIAETLAAAMDVTDVEVADLPTVEELAARRVRPRKRGEASGRGIQGAAPRTFVDAPPSEEAV